MKQTRIILLVLILSLTVFFLFSCASSQDNASTSEKIITSSDVVSDGTNTLPDDGDDGNEIKPYDKWEDAYFDGEEIIVCQITL